MDTLEENRKLATQTIQYISRLYK
ncbi:hypothetical protein [Phocaeicola sp. HCN-40430]